MWPVWAQPHMLMKQKHITCCFQLPYYKICILVENAPIAWILFVKSGYMSPNIVAGVEYPFPTAVASMANGRVWATLFNRRRAALEAKTSWSSCSKWQSSSHPPPSAGLIFHVCAQISSKPYWQALLFTLQQIETCFCKSCTTGSSKSHLRLQDDPRDILPIKGFYLCKHSCIAAFMKL